MRTSLRSSILQTVASNLRRERGTVAVFETARVYLTRPDDLPEEREMLIGGVGGVRLGRWGEPSPDPIDFFDAKGLLEEVFERVGAGVDFEAGEEFGLLRGRTAALRAAERAGVVGQVNPPGRRPLRNRRPRLPLRGRRRAPAAVAGPRCAPSLSRFPAVIQDLALSSTPPSPQRASRS